MSNGGYGPRCNKKQQKKKLCTAFKCTEGVAAQCDSMFLAIYPLWSCEHARDPVHVDLKMSPEAIHNKAVTSKWIKFEFWANEIVKKKLAQKCNKRHIYNSTVFPLHARAVSSQSCTLFLTSISAASLRLHTQARAGKFRRCHGLFGPALSQREHPK